MKLLKLNDVAEITTLNRVTIWRKARSGEFPAPVRVSEKRIAWREEDIIKYLKDLKTEPVVTKMAGG